MLIFLFFFFFFQAEDGIRDAMVTGVQTCALPISLIRSLSVLARTAAVAGWHAVCLGCSIGGRAHQPEGTQRTPTPMNPNTITTTVQRPNRILVILAAAWMVVSLTIGGSLTGRPSTDSSSATTTVTTASRP